MSYFSRREAEIKVKAFFEKNPNENDVSDFLKESKEEELIMILKNSLCPSSILRNFYYNNQNDKGILGIIVSNESCPIDIMYDFYDRNKDIENYRCLRSLIENNNCPSNILEDVLIKFNIHLMQEIISNKNCPDYIFKMVLFNKDSIIAGYFNCRMDIIKRIKRSSKRTLPTYKEYRERYTKQSKKFYVELLESIIKNESCCWYFKEIAKETFYEITNHAFDERLLFF